MPWRRDFYSEIFPLLSLGEKNSLSESRVGADTADAEPAKRCRVLSGPGA